MDPAFWDTSSLVPLCVVQPSSTVVRQLSAQYEIVVWWSSPVEMKSAFARLIRMAQLSPADLHKAQDVMRSLRQNWQEVMPNQQLRNEAEGFVDRFQLRAADAQQLAAAYIWAAGRPAGRVFLSGDLQLLEAARLLGFRAIQT